MPLDLGPQRLRHPRSRRSYSRLGDQAPALQMMARELANVQRYFVIANAKQKNTTACVGERTKGHFWAVNGLAAYGST